jgi:hypothetical protein
VPKRLASTGVLHGDDASADDAPNANDRTPRSRFVEAAPPASFPSAALARNDGISTSTSPRRDSPPTTAKEPEATRNIWLELENKEPNT